MKPALLHSLLLLWLAGLSDAATAVQASTCQTQISQTQVAQSTAVAPPQTGWQEVTLPDYWNTRWPGYEGSAWYRLVWHSDCTQVALTLSSIIMAGELFLNGQLIWRDPHLTEPLSRSWAMPRYWLLPEALRHSSGNTLLIRVVGQANNHAGLGVVTLGQPELLQKQYDWHYWNSRSMPLINLVVSLVLGLLAFGSWLWSVRLGGFRQAAGQEKAFGWYALTAGLWVIFAYFAWTTVTSPFPDSLSLARFVTLIYVSFSLCLSLFLWRLLNLHPRWLQRALITLALLAGCSILALPDFSGTLWGGHLGTLIFLLNCLYILWSSIKSRSAEHKIVALGLLLLLSVAVHDVLSLLQIIPSKTHFTFYSCMGFLLLIAGILGARVARNAQKIRLFNQEIMYTVERVSTELTEQLGREHQLALENSQSQERQRLAHELHDGLGGQIVRSIIQVEQSGRPLTQVQLLSILKLLRDDLRQLIDSGAGNHGAAPASPHLWAVPLMYRFDNLFDELGIELEWDLPRHWQTQPSALQGLLLARVVEEALTNVLKHSRATQVQVAMVHSPHALTLHISDNGKGFGSYAGGEPSLGVGIDSMKARMARVNGHLSIHSQPGNTRLSAHIPLSG